MGRGRGGNGGTSDFGGAGRCDSSRTWGEHANGAGGSPGHSDGPGGGGAASFKNIIAGSSSTVDARSESAVNTGDAHYSLSGSGGGGNCQQTGTRGRVVLIVGGEATAFDSPGSEATFVVSA